MLSVQPIDDAGAIDAILTDPWVASRIRHDDREPGYIDHPAVTYYGAYIGDALVGVFIAIRHSPWEVEAHAALLRFAVVHGRDLGRAFIRQVFTDPDVMRITAPVLSSLPSAANFCRRLGFVNEGVRRDAVKIDGVVADVIYLGLLRSAVL